MAKMKCQQTGRPKVTRGRPSAGSKPEKEKLVQLYVQESRSIRKTAEILGCKKDMVHYWLKKYGIEARTKAKRSKLLKYSLSGLKEGAKTKGVRGYARELGVNPSTLSRFLRSKIKK